MRWLLLSLSFTVASCGDQRVGKNNFNSLPAPNPLASSWLNSCLSTNPDEVSEKIDEYALLSRTAKEEGRYTESSFHGLTRNCLSEYFSSPKDKLAKKYEVLGELLSVEIKDFEAEKTTSLSAHYDSDSAAYEAPDFTALYHPKVLESVNEVIKDFGPLYINERLDPLGKPKATELKVNQPWSGYWFPFESKVLFSGESAPLVSFGRLIKKAKKENMQGPNPIADFEAHRHENLAIDSWEGLCDALSKAEILTREPKVELNVLGERFSIESQKALLTYAHLQYPSKFYGISYKGNAETDGTYQDLKPEAFHRIVAHAFEVDQRAIIVDDTAGPAVWNKPLFKYLWVVKKEKEWTPKIWSFTVKAWASYIKEKSRYEDSAKLSSTADVIVPSYEYRFFVDTSDRVKDDLLKDNIKYRVIAGQWTGPSYKTHPDTITYLLPQGELGSHNDEFNKKENMDIFKKYFLNK